MAIAPPPKSQFPDRCIVIGGGADGDTVDVDVGVNRMGFDRNCKPVKPDWDYYTNSPKVSSELAREVYRKEFIKASNKDGTHAIIPFLVIEGMSTADAIRKVFYSYRTRK